MKRSALVYGAVLVLFGLGILIAIERGRRIPPKPPTVAGVAAAATVEPAGSIWSGLGRNLREPLSRLFIQLLVILIATRAVGMLARTAGQPAVVGEMLAGVLLGPSLFGLVWPEGYAFVFSSSSLGTLRLLSQIGVCLFMFAVGMELDLAQVRGRAHSAVVVSHAGIFFPYFLGVAASLFLFPAFAGPGIPFVSFSLFMGIAMSITAFPVLARILQERALSRTSLGATALTCAAVDDVSAWSLLAVVVATVTATGAASTLLCIGLVVAFVAVMLGFIRPRLPQWLNAENLEGGAPAKGQIATVLGFTFAAALATELIGIHALFGAFLAGVVMPARSEFREFLKVRIESFGSIFLLPLFFAFTGLRTDVALVHGAGAWLVCAAIIAIATLGKLGGAMLAARMTGMPWKESFALGALMNTRGLMELIAINIGYDLGILSPEIFSMLVLMALATTFLTGPLLTLGGYRGRAGKGTNLADAPANP